jgi:D-serine deaminase-like pyridoxal phosphate-dependent protein
MSSYTPSLGVPLSEIDTPALLIHHEKLMRNIQQMANFCAAGPVKLRPHSKTHKCVPIAQRQLEAGAIGITCAKLGEAEALAAGGIQDILIANQIIGPIKIARLAQLAKHCNLMVAVDAPSNIRELSAAATAARVTIGCLVEVNIGMNRCGVEPGEPALALARQIAASPGLQFMGIQAYEGHLVNLTPFEERRARTLTDMQKAIDTKTFIEAAGLAVPIVSGGGTGTYSITGRMEGMTELQAGSYATMDAKYQSIGGADFENALSVLVTVISRPTPDVAVIDAGLKAMTTEFGLPTVEVEGAKLLYCSEEHAKISLSGAARDLRIGDKITLVPSHGCTTINLHDQLYVTEDERLRDIWQVVGRGKFQ